MSIALPALSQAHEYQTRAARVGFDCPEIEGVLDKICEEVAEVRQASDDAARCAELGDLFFALVNLTRWLKIAAETVLREANARFKTRFSDVGRTARERGKLLSEMNLEALDALWDEAKESSSQIEY